MGTIRSAVRLGRLAKFAAILILAPAVADAASLVKAIGARTRGASTTANSSTTVGVPSSGVAAGNSIVVTVQVASLGGTVACSDPSNGAYATDVVSPSGAAGIAIASKHNVVALVSGDIITCTYPSFNGASSMGAYEFSGLETAGVLDQTAQASSASDGAASSGLTAATSQPGELVFGLVWVPSSLQAFTPATSGSNPLENPYSPAWSSPFGAGTQKPMYRFVGSVRQYEANGTVTGAGGWIAQVATYRLAADLCTGVSCDDGSPCTDDACDPATGLCSHTPLPAGTSCGDLSSGICDSPDACDGAGLCQTNHVADGTQCSEVDSECDMPDSCLAGVCHDNGVKAAGVACGDPTSTECNAADSCNGSGWCVPNLAADGTLCGDAGTQCINQDTCAAGLCHDNGFVAAGMACGDPSSGQCDAADSCNGSGVCGANHVASGTSCNDGEACTNADACDGAGVCAGTRDELCFACTGNTAPVVSPVVVASPSEPVALVSGLVSVTASFTDTAGQSSACTIDWGDGSAPDSGVVTEPTATDAGTCTGSHLYTAVGVYAVAVTVTDACGESAGALYQYSVVYDPSAGFVTGAGWIDSPPGAYVPNPALTGRAHIGFVSAYLKGNSTVPSGRTDFHFSVANFNFSSSTYEWLVISGAKARFRGTGQVNGGGDYGFALTAWDGDAPSGGGIDRFRIRIWDRNQGDAVVYDNQVACPNQGDNADPCTALGEGAIVIHKK
jgi:Dictyostelium (slime mold) repeat